ncbi:MAG: histone deacetylase [Alphaproteobacteria bacterium]|nr:MAG: histone deacetylase [Alphaproteobacteria bacterium]
MTVKKKGPAPQKPIIYSPAYDIGVKGMEKLHPFDLRKYSHVFNELVQRGLIERGQEMAPAKLSREDIASVHTEGYLEKLNDKHELARIFEVPLVEKMPVFLTRKLILDPMIAQAGGSVTAGEAALENGWAINLGGGFHHASADKGHGFCAIADITLAVKKLREAHPEIKKVMIIDLDVHQGDGHERDFRNDTDTYIVDLYNQDVFPGDMDGRRRANFNGGMPNGTADKEYLEKLKAGLDKAAEDFKPDVIFYVAGSDILTGDPLGSFNVSAAGVVSRDEMVFDYALKNKIPIAMLFGGGYQPSNAGIIADSIENLDRKFGLLKGKPGNPAP